jgi:hypothetical protein
MDAKFRKLFHQSEMHSEDLIHNKIQWFMTTFTVKELENIKLFFEYKKEYEMFIYYGWNGMVYLFFSPLHIMRMLLHYPDSLTNIQNMRLYIDFICLILDNINPHREEIEHHPICI